MSFYKQESINRKKKPLNLKCCFVIDYERSLDIFYRGKYV